ncbi:hypothetical protein PoB_002562900 [Plakobranchus ocellatus]|uniref:Uncharacterized protein n=1 Tax=Plakobranchus ocellatus TaxID=259542 RepID=A0AAV3ZXK0_9GAST|nr:hypothetical protein PoB_002562900 [Plakobranchus ocellatus]
MFIFKSHKKQNKKKKTQLINKSRGQWKRPLRSSACCDPCSYNIQRSVAVVASQTGTVFTGPVMLSRTGTGTAEVSQGSPSAFSETTGIKVSGGGKALMISRRD